MKNLIPFFWKIFDRIYYFSIVAGIIIVLRLVFLDPIENRISEKGITSIFIVIGLVILIRFILKNILLQNI